MMIITGKIPAVLLTYSIVFFSLSCSQMTEDGQSGSSSVNFEGDHEKLNSVESVKNDDGEIVTLSGFENHESLNGDENREITHDTVVSHADQPLFEFEAPEGVEAQYSEPVMVTGSFLANVRKTLDCSSLSYIKQPPKFRDLPRGEGNIIFCIKLTIEDAKKYVITPDFKLAIDQSIKVSKISISGGEKSLHLGIPRKFQAYGFFSDGSKINVTSQVQWTVSDNSLGIMSNDFSQKGQLTSLKEGVVTIAASGYGLQSDNISIKVNPSKLRELSLSASSSRIAPQTESRLTVTGIFEDQSRENLTDLVSWMVSDDQLGFFSTNSDRSGIFVSGTQQGSVDLIASFQYLDLPVISNQISLIVSSATLVSLSVSSPNQSVPIGSNEKFVATGIFSDQSIQDMTELADWNLSDASMGILSNYKGTKGELIPKHKGQVNITANFGSVSSDNSSTSKMVSITDATLIGIRLIADQSSLPAGFQTQLVAMGTYSDGSEQNLTPTVLWTSSQSGVASVGQSGNDAGLFYGKSQGTVQVSAELGSVKADLPLTFTVTTATLQKVSVSSSLVQMALGFKAHATAIGHFSDQSTQDITSLVTFSSTQSSVVSVENSQEFKGLLTSVSTGESKISASYLGISSDQANQSVNLEVTAAILSSVKVSAPLADEAAGLSVALEATGVFSDASELNLTSQVTWSSGNPEIATVSNEPGSSGVLLGVTAGNVEIDAEYGGIKASDSSRQLSFQITSPELLSLSVASENTTLSTGQTEQLTGNGHYTDGSTQNLSNAVEWSSSLADAGTVNGAGLLTAGNEGSTTISISYEGKNSSESGGNKTFIIMPSMSYLNLSGTRKVTIDKALIPFLDHDGFETFAFWVRSRSAGASGMIYDRGASNAGRLTMNADGTFTYRYWDGTVTTPDNPTCSVQGTEWIHVTVRKWNEACDGKIEIRINGNACGNACGIGWSNNPNISIDVGDANIDVLDFRYDDSKQSVSTINADRFSQTQNSWMRYWNFSSQDSDYGLDGATSGGGSGYRESQMISDPRLNP